MAKYLHLLITALTSSCATSSDYVSQVSPVGLVDKVSCEKGRNSRSEFCVTNLDGFIRYHKEQDYVSSSNRGRVSKPEFIGSYEETFTDDDFVILQLFI